MGQLGAQANQDAAMARIQEQYNAQNQLGLTLHGARGQDEAMSQFNAGAQNQFAMANQDAQLRAWGLNDSAVLGALGGAAGVPQRAGLGEQLLAGGSQWLGFRLGQRGNNQQGGGQPTPWGPNYQPGPGPNGAPGHQFHNPNVSMF
jgi:hypothetical protein